MPVHGAGIVGWRFGAGWPLAWRSEEDSPSSVRTIAMRPPSPFGVVAFWQPHVPSMLAGSEVLNWFPEKQLFVDCIEPNAPPSSPMSAPPLRAPLLVSRLPENLLPDTW